MTTAGCFSFYTLDVFTSQRFGGNPLAVVLEGASLTSAQMQNIAREFNLSETTFVLPPETSGTHRVRIFTPAAELPFAGHPTVGTALLLHELDGKPETRRFVFEEGVGTVNVEVRNDQRGCFAELQATQPVELRPSALTSAELAALVSLSAPDIAGDACAASCGLPFLLVPVRDTAALSRARLDLARWETALRGTWAQQVYLYVIDGSTGDVRVRMFSPALGVVEDPATGSAAAAFAGFRASLDANRAEQSWTITQGIELGRPSTLHARVADGGTSVFVAGQAVRVSSGELWV